MRNFAKPRFAMTNAPSNGHSRWPWEAQFQLQMTRLDPWTWTEVKKERERKENRSQMEKAKTKAKANRNPSPMRKDFTLAKGMEISNSRAHGIPKEIHGRILPGTVVETILEKAANHRKVENQRTRPFCS